MRACVCAFMDISTDFITSTCDIDGSCSSKQGEGQSLTLFALVITAALGITATATATAVNVIQLGEPGTTPAPVIDDSLSISVRVEVGFNVCALQLHFCTTFQIVWQRSLLARSFHPSPALSSFLALSLLYVYVRAHTYTPVICL